MRKLIAIAAILALGIPATMAPSGSEPGSAQESHTLSLEQTSRLSNMITNENPAPLSNINLSVSIDSVVPVQINLRPLPSNVNDVAHQFSGYSYIVVEELIAIVDPKTRKIVAVLPRSRSQ